MCSHDSDQLSAVDVLVDVLLDDADQYRPKIRFVNEIML